MNIILIHNHRRGISFGRTQEAGIWWASKSRRRLCWRGHDSLYIAVGRLRIRVMKLHRFTSPGRLEAESRRKWNEES
jgi:hypothetical protein